MRKQKELKSFHVLGNECSRNDKNHSYIYILMGKTKRGKERTQLVESCAHRSRAAAETIREKMSECNLIVCLQPVYMRLKSITALSLSSSSAEKSSHSHLIIRLTSPRLRAHIFTTHNSHNMRPIQAFRRSVDIVDNGTHGEWKLKGKPTNERAEQDKKKKQYSENK